MKIEISFDDGHISDLRAAKLLKKYGMVGTFYIPNVQVPGTIRMSAKELKEGIVDLGMELGGHTVSHPMDMKLIKKDEDLEFQIVNNKILIDMAMRRLSTKFCYPRGRHDQRVRDAVKKAGYKEARTTLVLATQNMSGDPFQTPTTIHMFPREEYNGRDWYDVAIEKIYQASVGYNGFFSIWGHTKELDQYGYWEKFEKILKVLSPYATNAPSGV